ncbi:MAG TPA: hypothetical protein DEF04_00435 [Clostridiales bacterium]|nr:hypothetical protein [Clostridiales bacterium]
MIVKLTVKDMVQLLEPKGVQLISGKTGLSNRISFVHLMFNKESLNISTKEYLILIPFNLFGNNVEIQKGFIRHFYESGSAGIGMKLQLGEVLSKEIIQLADSLNFPLFEIPFELALSDVMNEVNISIFDK